MTKVLLADDDRDILAATARLLEAIGYDVVAVAKSADILEMAHAEHPDIILQDVNMPGLDIGAHLDAIRQDEELKALPVILFSGGTEAMDRYDELGANGFLEKPFDPRALGRFIESYTHPASDST